MCGHVNWRVIDEQITLRVHAATDVGNEHVSRASKNEREREIEGEREKNRGLSRTRQYTRALLLRRAIPLAFSLACADRNFTYNLSTSRLHAKVWRGPCY